MRKTKRKKWVAARPGIIANERVLVSKWVGACQSVREVGGWELVREVGGWELVSTWVGASLRCHPSMIVVIGYSQ